MSFPTKFLFAASTASYQVEGAWNEDGKGESIWDNLTHLRPEMIKNKDNGDIACDSYHQHKEDIRILKDIGFSVYRFSISWTRILPNGEITNISQAGVNYYNALIDELLKNGIEPMVTMYHWDLPQRLQNMGGWANPLIVDFMEDYADLLFKLYGNRVKWWITINEPKQIIGGYQEETYAPALTLDSPTNYIVAHNLLIAHGRIFRLYQLKYSSQQKGKISISIFSRGYKGKTDSKEDRDAAIRAYTFMLDWIAYPIFSKEGDYPHEMRQIIDHNSKEEGRNRSRLPTFTKEEIELIRGSYDFFSFNHYTASLCSPGKPPFKTTFLRDMNVHTEYDPEWPGSEAKWLKVVPWGIRSALLHIKNTYGNVPVFITENGICTDDKLEDNERIYYYREYLKQVSKAINEDGCNIVAYTAWSLLDNFEWMDGYSYKFGLVHVNFSDPKRKRTMKKSAKCFKEFLIDYNLNKFSS